MKALVVYGTRGGSTKQIADEIGDVLRGQGFGVTVADAKRSRGTKADGYDLVVVGSSVWAGAWTRPARAFVKRNAGALAGAKVAFFWAGWAGDDPVNREMIGQAIAKVTGAFPGIKPLGTAYFGSYTRFDSLNPIARLANGVMKKEFAKKGIDTSRPVDRRDWIAIRQWAADLAAGAKV